MENGKYLQSFIACTMMCSWYRYGHSWAVHNTAQAQGHGPLGMRDVLDAGIYKVADYRTLTTNHNEYIFILYKPYLLYKKYRICSRNLRTFFSILAAEKSGCVIYADFFCGGLDLGFILA